MDKQKWLDYKNHQKENNYLGVERYLKDEENEPKLIVYKVYDFYHVQFLQYLQPKGFLNAIYYTYNKSKAQKFDTLKQINEFLNVEDVRQLPNHLVVFEDDEWTLEDVKKELNIA